jgi:hypothetical protein
MASVEAELPKRKTPRLTFTDLSPAEPAELSTCSSARPRAIRPVAVEPFTA